MRPDIGQIWAENFPCPTIVSNTLPAITTDSIFFFVTFFFFLTVNIWQFKAIDFLIYKLEVEYWLKRRIFYD